MHLFTCFFYLAAKVLFGHKHFSVSCEQIQFEFVGWNIKSANH